MEEPVVDVVNNLSDPVEIPANCTHFAQGVCFPSFPFLHSDQALDFIHSCVQGRVCLLFFQMGTAFSLFHFYLIGSKQRHRCLPYLLPRILYRRCRTLPLPLQEIGSSAVSPPLPS